MIAANMKPLYEKEAVKAGKSTFQWVGGYQKYTYFVYIWDTLYLKYL